jgi:signal transduction histidine kinase
MQEKLTGMMKTLSRLKKIVHSLLFISRIENDQFANTAELKISGLIGEMIEQLGPRMEAKEISFHLDVDNSVSLHHINHDLLFQLIYNLVNNAIRYNKDGGHINITDKYEEKSGYTLLIEDTGVGIAGEEIGNIFDRFKKSTKGTEEGYGLGLYIVKTIAQYYELHIGVRSEVNKGTEFSIGFPGSLCRKE